MRTPIALAIALLASLLLLASGCSKFNQGISGEWKLQLGKSVNTLQLEEASGRISGLVRIDPAWGGESTPLTGLLVGNHIELQYTLRNLQPGVEIDYCYRGDVVKERMSGTCSVTGSASGALWIAERKQ